MDPFFSPKSITDKTMKILKTNKKNIFKVAVSKIGISANMIVNLPLTLLPNSKKCLPRQTSFLVE